MSKIKGCPAGILAKDDNKWWITLDSACGYPGKTGPFKSRKKAIEDAKSFGFKTLLDESPAVIKSKKYSDGKMIILKKSYSKRQAEIDIINSPFGKDLGWVRGGRLTKAGRDVVEQGV